MAAMSRAAIGMCKHRGKAYRVAAIMMAFSSRPNSILTCIL